MKEVKKMDKWHKDYHRYEATKWDLENGAVLPPHKLEQYEKLKKIFEM